MKTVEVLYTPADFAGLPHRDLARTACVVFDVFRATTSIVTALANGAAAVIPVADIPEALRRRQNDPTVLLAGERNGVRIRADLAGGIDFDLGNSPREFTRERVAGRTIVSTTTNGTRALRACAHARTVWISSFLNLRSTAGAVGANPADDLVIVCSGTFEQAAYEDVLGAGALCDLLWNHFALEGISDAALIARKLFRAAQEDLLKAAAESRNGRRLLARAELHDDVPFCLQPDRYDFAAVLQPNGAVTKA